MHIRTPTPTLQYPPTHQPTATAAATATATATHAPACPTDLSDAAAAILRIRMLVRVLNWIHASQAAGDCFYRDRINGIYGY